VTRATVTLLNEAEGWVRTLPVADAGRVVFRGVTYGPRRLPLTYKGWPLRLDYPVLVPVEAGR
jgi:hypothetical protein